MLKEPGMYFLFSFVKYYPYGGMKDFKGCFSTIGEAKGGFDSDSDDNAHIATIREGELVFVEKYENSIYGGKGEWEMMER